jgi:membrane-associated phospholipid phosphatase
MMLRNAIEDAEKRLIAVDDETAKLFKPYKNLVDNSAVHAISKLGDQPELRTIAGTIILAGIAFDSDRMVRAGSRMVIAHEAATLTKDALKLQIDRKRPRSARDRSEAKPRRGNSKAKELSSFPSGHSAGGIAAARAFAREYPEYGSAALVGAGLIAVLQVSRSAHYVSDVLAGVAIGIAVEAATNALWSLARMDERSETPD